MDLSGISFDLGDNEDADKAALNAESAEVNTKIDLVSAYIDMDDIEGAKELLEEVLKEGGSNQRQYAQKLLDSLA
jgi:pilus assembly protein FimV